MGRRGKVLIWHLPVPLNRHIHANVCQVQYRGIEEGKGDDSPSEDDISCGRASMESVRGYLIQRAE